MMNIPMSGPQRVPKRTSRPPPPPPPPTAIEKKNIIPDPWNAVCGQREEAETGPKITGIRFSDLPKGCRMVTIGFWFISGDRALIWPEGDDTEVVQLLGPDGEADLPVGPHRQWMIDLPAGTSVATKLENAW
jgi:hypothetical protein